MQKNYTYNNELQTEAKITTASKINAYAFRGCYRLTSVTFKNPDGWHTDLDGKDVDLDLTDIENNAVYLESIYCNYDWYKA